MKVIKSSDVIEKCLWILRKQFKFVTTRKLNLKRLTSLNQTLCDSLKLTLNMLEQMKFPVLIGVSSTLLSYDHVVVIWNGIVIDYKSMYTYPLTEESLRQVGFSNDYFWLRTFPTKGSS